VAALSPAHLALGNAVRARREKLGLSQEGLADRATLHRNHIGLIERGEVDLGLHRLLLLSHALAVPAAQLVDAAERANGAAA
jgi:transcriptional regulator with XRE-family HTH domain